MHKTCASEDDPTACVPGCFSGGKGCPAKGDGCYPPDSLKAMMEAHEEEHPYNLKCTAGAHGGSKGCQYNELVLDARYWMDSLPRNIEGVFFPAGGEESAARAIHSNLLRAFGLTSTEVPLLKLTLSNRESPFEVASDRAASPVCKAVLADESKFYQMWGGSEAWTRMLPGEELCWESRGGKAFFDRVL